MSRSIPISICFFLCYRAAVNVAEHAFPARHIRTDTYRHTWNDFLQPGFDGGGSSLHKFREAFSVLSSHSSIIKGQRAAHFQTHDILFFVKKRNIDEVERLLYDVSYPSSANYGKHMTHQEVVHLTSNPESYREVVEYLAAAGAIIIPYDKLGECVTARASIGLWERILNTEFHSYSMTPFSADEDLDYPARNRAVTVLRADKYSVPLDIDSHVSYAYNVIDIPFKISMSPRSAHTVIESLESSPSSRFTEETRTYYPYMSADLLKRAYNSDEVLGHPRATQAAFEIGDQWYCPEDVRAFQKLFVLPRVNANETTISHVATQAQCRASLYAYCAESNVDMAYLMAMANVPTIHDWFGGNTIPQYLEELLARDTQPPLMISISYSQEEEWLSSGEKQRFTENAMSLGLMGSTIVAASGDNGALSRTVKHDLDNCRYRPLHPASDPYVISVGATQGLEFGLPETASMSSRGGGITSGGGFSTFHEQIPLYQKRFVEGYLAKMTGSLAPYPGFGTGRGYPDISAAGSNYVIYVGGNTILLSGTSISAPVIAAMLSNINVARLNAGAPAIGWIHPALYSDPAAYTNDITVGKNNCTSSPACCVHGFNAAVGWDPVSGLGTLDARKFKRHMCLLVGIEPPSDPPSSNPTFKPSRRPTRLPTVVPTFFPTSVPSATASVPPTLYPSKSPSLVLISTPSRPPSVSPNRLQSSSPTRLSSLFPTKSSSSSPIKTVSRPPIVSPNRPPSSAPTRLQSATPSMTQFRPPTVSPIRLPSSAPTRLQSATPSVTQSRSPTVSPNRLPSSAPTRLQSATTSMMQSRLPSSTPAKPNTIRPSIPKTPAMIPTSTSSSSPSSSPSLMPTTVRSATPASDSSLSPTSPVYDDYYGPI